MNASAAFWRAEAPALAVLALVITVLLLRARPYERSVFLNTLWLFLAGLAGQAVAAGLQNFGFSGAAQGTHTVFRIVTAVALIRMFGFAVFRLAMPMLGKHPTRIIEDLTIIVAYVGYGLVQLRGAGVDLGSLVTTSAILTAVVAFAMQDTLGNVLAGLAIQLDNSVQVGDWVKVDNLAGRVRDIRWRSTLIETRDWETVVIPNSMLMKQRVAILGRREGAPSQLRRVLSFMVDPGVP
ncbi:MAG TPA: mechanosensitive ion channel domain-containing protein, partial [Burkholderiales bacterium]|nr:mechanosensitive ion channel domain-containing protein [Burkholderiales bacterium]